MILPMLVVVAAFCGACQAQSGEVVVTVPQGIQSAFVDSPCDNLRWSSVRSGQKVRLAEDESLSVEIWHATPGKITALREIVGQRKLNSLNVMQSHISAEIWAEIAALENLPELRLGGGFLPPTMDDCAALAKMRGLQRLRFGDEKLLAKALVAVAKLPSLTELDIPGKMIAQREVREALAGLRHVRAIDLGVLHEVSDAELACLTQLPALERLECYICPRDPCQGEFLRSLAGKLKELVVDAEPADPAAFAKIVAGLTSLERLHLDLSGSYPCDETLSAAIGALPALRRLSISGKGTLSATGLAALAERGILTDLKFGVGDGPTDDQAAQLGRIKSLRNLSCRAHKIGNNGFNAIAKLDLESLVLWGAVHADSGAVQTIAGMKSLEVLAIGGPGVDDAAAEAVSKLANLRTLFVWSDNLTSTGGRALAALSKLRHLDCEACPKIGDRALASWVKLPLWRLDLAETGITDRGVAALGALKELRWLDLSQTHVTDNGIAALQSLPRLEYLGLNRCPGITAKIGPGVASMMSLLFITVRDCAAMSDADLEKALAKANAQPFTSSTEVANEDVRVPGEKAPPIPPPPEPADQPEET